MASCDNLSLLTPPTLEFGFGFNTTEFQILKQRQPFFSAHYRLNSEPFPQRYEWIQNLSSDPLVWPMYSSSSVLSLASLEFISYQYKSLIWCLKILFKLELFTGVLILIWHYILYNRVQREGKGDPSRISSQYGICRAAECNHTNIFRHEDWAHVLPVTSGQGDLPIRVTQSSRLTNGPPLQTLLLKPTSQMLLVSVPEKAPTRAVLFKL